PSGLMLPQGRSERGTGVPRWVDQRTFPEPASSAYTVSFSVPASTVPPTTSGCPYTAPSSAARQARDSDRTGGIPGADPLRRLSRWYVGQSPGPRARPGSGLVGGPAGDVEVVGEAGGPEVTGGAAGAALHPASTAPAAVAATAAASRRGPGRRPVRIEMFMIWLLWAPPGQGS